MKYLLLATYIFAISQMAAKQNIKIGVYGPVSSGKSLFILRWCNPTLQMNQDDLTGNPFINLYKTTLFDASGIELIEHPSDDKIDPSEDKFIIIANLLGWREHYEQACKINQNATFLVFTWKDKPSSGVLSAKIHEKHDDCSSYSGAGFEQFKAAVLNRKRNAGNNKRKKRVVTDGDGWSTK